MMREMVYLPEQIQIKRSMGVTRTYSESLDSWSFAGYDDNWATTLTAGDISYWKTLVSSPETDTFLRIRG